MINSIKWYKGLSITAYIDFDDKEEYVTLTYADRNKLIGGEYSNIYFNESLFPRVYKGLEMYVTIDGDLHKNRALEVVDIIE